MVSISDSYSKEYSVKAAQVLCECFRKDPVMTWLTCDLTVERRQAWFPQGYSVLMAACYGGGCRFYEAEDWASCAVTIPPGKRIDGVLNMLRAGIITMLWGIGIGGVKRAIAEYEGASDKLRIQTLGKEESYYVFSIGTLESHRGRGLCVAQMKRIQNDAIETGHPVWLEATTAGSRDIYAKLGFVEVGEVKLGVGLVGADGFLKKDGEGVTIWGMYWRHERNKETK